VTAAARITQADIDRAIKAAARFECARIILRLDKAEIEIFIGESAGEHDDAGEWSDDD
jgi:hypothetical protein